MRRSKTPGGLEVWSEDVREPVAVRYAWSGYPTGNAVGHDLLPVPPFRTDDWPLVADTPFEPQARKAWDEEMKRLRAAAARASDARELREARALIARLTRELGEQLPDPERTALAKQVADASAALERLGEALEHGK